jgi:anti-sigma B factor antagonist
MEQLLTIGVRRQPGHVLVTLAGELDIATEPRLSAQLTPLAVSGRPLIVDLGEVVFIDAAGLRALARAAWQAAACGGSLHVVSAESRIRQLLAITGLGRHIRLARTVAEARDALRRDQGAPGDGG